MTYVFKVCRMSQYLSKYAKEQLNATFRKSWSTSHVLGLMFKKESNLTINGFSDSDWGAYKETRKSTTDLCFYRSSLISWKSKKQQIVSNSSSEGEYRVVANASCEAQWLLYLMADFGIPHQQPISIFCDNSSVIHIIKNSVIIS